MDTPRVARLDALTSLRFIAAAMIVVHHTRGYFGIPGDWGGSFPLELGVSFFFVLSGFILTYVYPTVTWKDVPRFWLARYARIWPAHVTAFVLLLVLVARGGLLPFDTVRTAIPNLLLVHAWSPNTEYFFSFNGPSWSVSTELGFYVLFPLLIWGLRRTWAVKLVVSILLVVAMVTAANTMLGLPILKSYQVSAYGLVYASPLGRLSEFVLGMCTCLLWQRLRASERLTPRWCTVGEVAAVVLTVLLMRGALVAAGHPALGWIGDGGRLWLAHSGSAALGFAAVILTVALGRGALARVLAFPALVLLGEISYSVYLLHQILLRAYAMKPALVALPFWFVYPAYWAVMLGLAYLIWRLVERPARRLLVGLAGGSATQPGLASRPSPTVESVTSDGMMVSAGIPATSAAPTSGGMLAGPPS